MQYERKINENEWHQATKPLKKRLCNRFMDLFSEPLVMQDLRSELGSHHQKPFIYRLLTQLAM
jgi:hypothetical protein